jgi:hypothetical protein
VEIGVNLIRNCNNSETGMQGEMVTALLRFRDKSNTFAHLNSPLHNSLQNVLSESMALHLEAIVAPKKCEK